MFISARIVLMKHKILIADDSLTIQKVIKITLASEPFDLFECLSVAELMKSVQEIRPKIVLLDFNLSEEKTGYDLARDIKKHIPNVKILMLFGTFDTIDEGLLADCGVSHKIVKPFDGTKFINLCRVMADELDHENAQTISETEDDFDISKPLSKSATPAKTPEPPVEPDFDEDDQWVVEGSNIQEEFIDEAVSISSIDNFSAPKNQLMQDMQDWGMDVPGVIGVAKTSSMEDIPGVITESGQSFVPIQDEINLPAADDLAYPDIIDVREVHHTEEEKEVEKLPSASDLEFPDLDSLKTDFQLETKADRQKPKLRSIEIEDEPVVETIEVSAGGTDTDEALSALKAEIEDELDDKIEASDDLWGADVVVDNLEIRASEETTGEFDLPDLESHQLEKIVDNTQKNDEYSYDFDDSFEDIKPVTSTPDDFPIDVMEEEVVKDKPMSRPEVRPAAAFAAPSAIDSKELEERLREKLTPVVEKLVKDFCRESVEKIAWEIIPDLAENLIRKEIQKISDSIMNQ
jgi:CheY-like chemotaxis protein